MEEVPKYSERIQRLEQIVTLLQTGQDVDELMHLFKEGKQLYEFCLNTLDEAEKSIHESEK